MNRRKFLGGIFGALLAPKIASSIEAAPVVEKVVVSKVLDYEVLGYTGTEMMGSGYIYAPYIPLIQTRSIDNMLITNISKQIQS